ncbi:TPA: TraR/DksA C4-type zinc finger protein [Pseudomonas aeruginosa]|nr:TraR/DksA C4-type zinc finger protein [Pseudomonas aeruginosa]
MADCFDRAQARELQDRELALQAHQVRARPSGPSLTHCLDCGELIPEARRALGGMIRCTPCQARFEKGGR